MTDREQDARHVCDRLRSAEYVALFAGGCVRDYLLGCEPRDFDIATNARAEAVLALFDHTHAVGAAFGVVSVLLPSGPVEVATFRHDGPYEDGRRPSKVRFTDAREDAARRDFTINALFLDPESNEVIDYVGGKADLAAGVVRTVGDAGRRFEEDHLRLMRCVRFAARLGFSIAADTWNGLLRHAHHITSTSPERIRDELLKMLTEGHPRRAMELLLDCGLLGHVLPEVEAMVGVEQPPAFHPEGDVWTHTMIMLDLLERPSPTLAMGTLLHDVGKPPTQTFAERIRFDGHDGVGVEMARAICERLRFSNADTDRICWLVGQHMRLATAKDMRESKRRRLVREPGFAELLDLCRADCLSSHRDVTRVDWLADYAQALQPEALRPEPLLRGGDLMALGFAPGPVMGRILRAVEEAQLDGELETREDAVAFVRSFTEDQERP